MKPNDGERKCNWGLPRRTTGGLRAAEAPTPRLLIANADGKREISAAALTLARRAADDP